MKRKIRAQPIKTSLPVFYQTGRGIALQGFAEQLLRESVFAKRYRRRVQLIFTSPPFPLNRKKRYGNEIGQQYVEWLANFGPLFRDLLTADGSIVMEVGNAWEPGSPVMSTLALEALLAFMKRADLKLCQQFICYNPARLPTPAQWVTIDRIRVKDAYTHVWWMAPSERPKADNRRVLKPYSEAMRSLLRSKSYNAGQRPSQHKLNSTSFLKDNKGAIPPNVLTISNTSSTDPYQRFCKDHWYAGHPARMPEALPDFFVRFLTDPGNLVMDPFAGSNTTGAVAERLKRRWIAIEPEPEYLAGSIGRFPQVGVT
jgi:site-specific DNA-methyltransferase (cytosine-N4-specific)